MYYNSRVLNLTGQKEGSKKLIVYDKHKLNFSNSPLNNSGEVIGFGGELRSSSRGVSLLTRQIFGR
jgi:hypothetical protein